MFSYLVNMGRRVSVSSSFLIARLTILLISAPDELAG